VTPFQAAEAEYTIEHLPPEYVATAMARGLPMLPVLASLRAPADQPDIVMAWVNVAS
jgi:hypothetical protein